jgi:hypothetical protein
MKKIIVIVVIIALSGLMFAPKAQVFTILQE